MIDNIIFDWSGTLSDSVGTFHEVCKRMFKELGGNSDISLEEIRETFTLPYMSFWNHHFPDLTKERQDVLYQKFMKEVNKDLGSPDVYQNVRYTVGYLFSAGFKLCVLSSDYHSTLIPELQKADLYDLFTRVVGEAHEKSGYLMDIITTQNFDHSRTLYVGDTSGDIEAGKLARVKTCGITWGYQNKRLLENSNPDYLIDDIVELKDMIKAKTIK